MVPHFAAAIRKTRALRDELFEGTVEDPERGPLRLTGRLLVQDPKRLVVILHGLGGSEDSRYVVDAAKEARRAGLSYLRANMRGADRSGEDIYHAGLTDDVRGILASEPLAGFEEIFLLGYSMGGHTLLRWASEPGRDPRVKAVAAVCAPLDLGFGASAIQRPAGLPYQWHVLRGLKEIYAAAAERREMPVGAREARAIRTILEWDEKVVVPRFGFGSRRDYYESMSAGPRLWQVEVPSLIVAAEADPIVTADQLRPWLTRTPGHVDVAWTRGGHVAFPRGVFRVTDAHPETADAQVLAWLLQRSEP